MVGIDGHDVFEAGDRPVRSHRLIIGLAEFRGPAFLAVMQGIFIPEPLKNRPHAFVWPEAGVRDIQVFQRSAVGVFMARQGIFIQRLIHCCPRRSRVCSSDLMSS